MALGVLNNISAISAQNNLANTQASLSKTLQQLSSGSRINSGADDAAGLSLANGLQASSTALSQSAKNASEGVDFLQVADGALSQVTNLLNRAVTLATEASNGTLNSSQTSAADSEYQKILTEVNTINNNTEYNGINTFVKASSVSVGSANDAISTTGSGAGGVLTLSYKDNTGATQTATISSADSTTVGTSVLKANATVSDLAAAINTLYGSSIASVQGSQLILTGGATLNGSTIETNSVSRTNVGAANATSTLTAGNASDTFAAATTTVYEAGAAGAAAVAAGTGGTPAVGAKGDLGAVVKTGDFILKDNSGKFIDVGANGSGATYAVSVGTVGSAKGAVVTESGTTAVGSAAAAGFDSFGRAITAADATQMLKDGSIVDVGAVATGATTAVNKLAVQVGNGASKQVTFLGSDSLSQVVADINKAAGSNVASLQGNNVVLAGATLYGSTLETGKANASASNQNSVSIFTSDGTISQSYNNNASDLIVANTASLGLANSSLTSSANAQGALASINAAIMTVAADRGTLGANINTLTAVGSVMTMQSTNTLAAMNDVTATDYGQATSDMSKYQILSQTGIAALSQANQSQQLITKLLQ
jgi:flagellin